MNYDFDRVVDRSAESAVKHVNMQDKFGRSDLIPLWVADMDIPTAPAVTQALQQRLSSGMYGYTVCPESYYQALIGWQQRRNGWTPSRELMSNGVSIVAALKIMVQQFSQPGDEILFFTPAYPPFFAAPEQWGRTPLPCPLLLEEDGYQIDWEAFEAALQRKPAFMILCSPHNPVGRCWTREELAEISRLCLAYRVLVVSDEIHSDLVLWGNKHIPTASLSPAYANNTVTCLSASKSFNLAGMQICTIHFPTLAHKALYDDLLGRIDNAVNAFGYLAAETAWNQGEAWFDQLRSYIEGNVRLVEQRIAQLTELSFHLPQATYLVWLDCRGLGLDGDALMDLFINQARLAPNDGRDFHAGPGWVRLNLACPRPVLAEALDRLAWALQHRAEPIGSCAF